MDYLIVGLGNPGAKYHKTRHNIGFEVLDFIAHANQLDFVADKHAERCTLQTANHNVLLIKPITFMNLSGKALLYWMQWYKIPLQNILVVVDDIALPVGKMRLRAFGSSAGHNGLKDIERVLGSQNYSRLRFGVGNDFAAGQQSRFVLSKFPENDLALVNLQIEKAAQAVLYFVEHGIEKTMAQFN